MINNKCNIETDLDARYISYPETPYWNNTDSKSTQYEWIQNVKRMNLISENDGISLYIHLPFCETLCSFCCFNPYISKHHHTEKQYINYLIKEWNLYLKLLNIKPYIKQLYVGGGTPTYFSSENLKLLLTTILSSVTIDHNSILEFEGHVNNTTSKHLIELNKLGFKYINIGTPDFDTKVLQTINRSQPYENVQNIIKTARDIGYKNITLDLIYGLPFQSRKTAINSIYKIRALKPDRIRLYEYKNSPKKNPAQKTYQEHLPIELEKNALLTISKQMLEESGYHNIGMNHFVQKNDPLYKAKTNKSLHRNMMGYTPQKTNLSIGLGASAISDSWNATVQNERSLKTYYNAIDKNMFPISKGYFLNSEDNILRRHILNLQCKYETKWDSKKENTAILNKNMVRLKQYEKFNLLKISENSIKIKKAGREFIRDICNLLDSRVVAVHNAPITKSKNEVLYGVKV